VVVLACAALCVLAACSGTWEGPGMSSPPPVVTESEAKAQVRQIAHLVVAAVGDPEIGHEDVTAGPCGGEAKDYFDVAGIYQIIVPAEQQRAALQRAKDWARNHGFEITTEKDLPSGLGTFTAVKPSDRVDFTLGSGEPPAMVLIVSSSC
jgi:hypothetical protein